MAHKPMTAVAVRLSDDDIAYLKNQAYRLGISKSDVIRQSIRLVRRMTERKESK